MGTLKPSCRAVVISAGEADVSLRCYLRKGDFVIACDAGYQNAARLGVTPDLIVGDFDSAPMPETSGNTIVLPHRKDDTDTHYAARWLVEQGASEAVLLGALGGARLEHTLANIATGLFLEKAGVKTTLANARSELRYLLPGTPLHFDEKAAGGGSWMYFSLFPLEGTVSGLTIKGASYLLENAALTADCPLGVSNEFLHGAVTVSCKAGCGLLVLTRADGEPL